MQSFHQNLMSSIKTIQIEVIAVLSALNCLDQAHQLIAYQYLRVPSDLIGSAINID